MSSMTNKKSLKTSKISQSVLLAMTMLASTQAMADTADKDGNYKNIGDLEIYKLAEGGGATVTMMLDISGSMTASDTGCDPKKDARGGAKTYYLTATDGSRINSFKREDGTTVDTSKGVLLPYLGCGGPTSRIELLKQSMMDLVYKDGSLANIKLGVGTFPTPMNQMTGRMAIPAKPLTLEHRWDILNFIASTYTVGATPSAVAYVEAGAYMLGTKTTDLGANKKVIYTVGRSRIINGQDMQLLYCGSAPLGVTKYTAAGRNPDGSLFGVKPEFAKPFNVNINGETISWYTCNDGSDATFPPLNWDQRTQSGDQQARFGSWGKLNFNLFPKFDYLAQDLKVTKSAKNSDKSDSNGDYFRLDRGQLARVSYDFGRMLNYREPTVDGSGFAYSEASTKKSDGNTYQSPIDGNGQCDGYGIYFLTDGEPNMVTDKVLVSANMSLNKSGSYSSSVSKTEFPDGVGNAVLGRQSGYWNFIASYAKDLRSGNNPLKVNIKTATVGFGKVFDGASDRKTLKKIDGKDVQVTDCNAINSQDGKNLCKWGEKGWGYGEGGFLATSNAKAVTDSVIEFAESLNKVIDPSPAGTISIPRDPLSISNIQPYAYLPVVEPKPSESPSIWKGNLKKYHTLDGTLYGRDGTTRLYTTSTSATSENTNYPFAINSQAKDIWQEGSGSGSAIEVGGSLNKIPELQNKTTTRQVFVEVVDTRKQPATKKLQKVSVSNGSVQGLDTLIGYTMRDKAYLMNYLGFAVDTNANYANDAKLIEAVKIAKTTTARNLGGVVHSVPVLATYKGNIDDVSGNVTSDEDNRDDNIIYGSMDGGLHMVNAKEGVEQFTFIPRAMFENEKQREAMVLDSKSGIKGSPAFGVDAPWMVNASYKFGNDSIKFDDKKGMYAYGGLRMGGNGIYGLNITDKAKPQLAFAINDKTPEFERMGQIWSKPLVANIKKGNTSQQVLIFGGGYDMCYEDPKFKLDSTTNRDPKCNSKSQVQGNAIYMIDAKSGALIQKWDSAKNTNMKHSIVAEINGLDRNNDGMIDHLYAADLGGQIFRVDLRANGTSNVVRVFDANAGISKSDHINFRFYERPIVSFYSHNNGRFAVINVASGDRSSPLSKNRGTDTSENTDANRIYGIFDKDVANSERGGVMATNPSYQSKDLNSSHLQRLDTKKIEKGNDGDRKALLDGMKTGKKSGWYYDMIRFAGNIDVPHLKAVGPGMVTGSVYYASIYSPDYQYSKGSSCSAGIEGGTERQMYCLPWGICANDNGQLNAGNSSNNSFKSKNGTLGFIKAGPGIQELTMTTLTKDKGKSSPFRAIISHQTTDEQIKDPKKYDSNVVTGADGGFGNPKIKGNINNGGGSDYLARRDYLTDSFTLRVQRWYDLQDAETK